jgi:hypothetical protein
LGLAAIQNRLLLEGVPTAEGKRVWALRTLRKVLMSDEVRPHSSEEVRQLVTPEVAARLNPHEEYGIQWYNRQKVAVRTISEPDDNGGRRYRNSRTFAWRLKEEWVAIPVPAYLSRTLVDRAHAALKNNRAFERKHPARTWELKGLMRCGCGLKMSTRTAQPKGAPRRYHYYECKRYRICKEICSSFQKSFRAEKVEEAVWSFVSCLLKEPERIKAGMEALIEQERANGPRHFAKEESTWAEKIAECARLRSAFQDQQAAGLMTIEELGAKLKELERTNKLAQVELEAITLRKERVEELEMNRDVLLESLSSMLPEALDALEPEERSRVYRMLQLDIIPTPQGLRVSGALDENFVKQERHLPVGPELRRRAGLSLHALPAGSGDERVKRARAEGGAG